MRNLSIWRSTGHSGDCVGTVTSKGVETGTSATGTKYARFTISVPSEERDVNSANFNLGTKDTRVTLETSPSNKDPKTKMLFVRCVAYNKLAELVSKYIQAGTRVRCLGEVKINEYQGKQTLDMTITYLPDFVGPRGKTNDADVKAPKVEEPTPTEEPEAQPMDIPEVEDDSDKLPWEL